MQNTFKSKLPFFLLMQTTTLLSITINNTNDMLNYVKNFVPSNPIILEAGGHYGEDTQRMKKIWPDATIHVFEPLPSSFEKLAKNTHHLSDIKLYKYALSNFSGKTHFFINPTNDGASSIGFPTDQFAVDFIKTPIEIEVSTINQWTKNAAINHIDFMWLDMEGHELNALKSSLDILHSVKAIYTEINFIHLREDGCLYHDLKEFLESQGFKEVWKHSYSHGWQGDALFIKP